MTSAERKKTTQARAEADIRAEVRARWQKKLETDPDYRRWWLARFNMQGRRYRGLPGQREPEGKYK